MVKGMVNQYGMIDDGPGKGQSMGGVTIDQGGSDEGHECKKGSLMECQRMSCDSDVTRAYEAWAYMLSVDVLMQSLSQRSWIF